MGVSGVSPVDALMALVGKETLYGDSVIISAGTGFLCGLDCLEVPALAALSVSAG